MIIVDTGIKERGGASDEQMQRRASDILEPTKKAKACY